MDSLFPHSPERHFLALFFFFSFLRVYLYFLRFDDWFHLFFLFFFSFFPRLFSLSFPRFMSPHPFLPPSAQRTQECTRMGLPTKIGEQLGEKQHRSIKKNKRKEMKQIKAKKKGKKPQCLYGEEKSRSCCFQGSVWRMRDIPGGSCAKSAAGGGRGVWYYCYYDRYY